MKVTAVMFCSVLLLMCAAPPAPASATREETGASPTERPPLRIAVESIPDGYEPAMTVSNIKTRTDYSIYDHFIKRAYWETAAGDGGTLVPSIAESWKQVSPTVWEFKIRQGVKFHDGSECTAEDVAFTFSEERMFGAKRMIPIGPSYFGTLKKVEVVDKYTVRFETKQTDPAFLARFASSPGFVVPKKQYLELGIEKFNLAPIGTGPYKFGELKARQYVRFDAFDDYWGGKPAASSVTFFEIPEFSGRLTALFNGEVDIIANITPDQIDTIKNRPGFQLLPSMIENYRELCMNIYKPLNPIMKDKRMRQAIAYAIDRQLIVDQLWKGYSEVPRTMNFQAHGEYYLNDRPMIPYDPERSKALLKDAGYKGEELSLRVNGSYYANYLEAAQIMQQMWKAVGINVRIEVRDANATAMTEGGYDMRAWSVGLQIKDPLFPLWSDYSPTTARSRAGSVTRLWAIPKELVDLGAQLSTVMDTAERRRVFSRVVDLMEDEMVSVGLYRASEFYAVRKGVEWKPYTLWMMDFGPGNLKFTSR